jgi:hypothetical protein
MVTEYEVKKFSQRSRIQDDMKTRAEKVLKELENLYKNGGRKKLKLLPIIKT